MYFLVLNFRFEHYPSSPCQNKYQQRVGQHLKKASLSESSSDMMDLEDGVESTPGLLSENRMVPFLGSHTITEKQQQQNCCKQPIGGQNLQQRHNSALAVSIETDV